MPKRAKTPPTADDEPKYLSVVHPYPKTHPNMELEGDQIRFCFWLACSIGGNPLSHDYPLRAFYYRPKVRLTLIASALWIEYSLRSMISSTRLYLASFY